jgi:hypothetical protein
MKEGQQNDAAVRGHNGAADRGREFEGVPQIPFSLSPKIGGQGVDVTPPSSRPDMIEFPRELSRFPHRKY